MVRKLQEGWPWLSSVPNVCNEKKIQFLNRNVSAQICLIQAMSRNKGDALHEWYFLFFFSKKTIKINCVIPRMQSKIGSQNKASVKTIKIVWFLGITDPLISKYGLFIKERIPKLGVHFTNFAISKRNMLQQWIDVEHI